MVKREFAELWMKNANLASMEGIREIQNLQVLRNKNFAKWGTAPKIVKMFGGKEKYFQAVDELTSLIYNNEISANQGNNIYNL